MSVKRNTIANYLGQAYSTAIGIIMLPFYMEYLGVEAYGLVGVFVLMQSWLALLISGLAPTITREVAKTDHSKISQASELLRLLKSIEFLVFILAVITSITILQTNHWLTNHWLTIKTLNPNEVANALALMGFITSLKWGVGLYSAGIYGLEQQIWLNLFNIIFATLRYVCAYALLRWISNDFEHYFQFQLAIGIVEFLVIYYKFHSAIPRTPIELPLLYFSYKSIKPALPFIAGIAYTSVLWVLMTQTDKLILSHTLTLAEFGFYSIVATLANSALRLSEPINQAVLPRLTSQHASGKTKEMLSLYKGSTQVLSILSFSTLGTISLFATPFIYSLTGNHQAAAWGGPILFWLALGNAVMVITGMQYNLQFAIGKVQLHVINTTINAIIQVPILAYVAYYHGAIAVAMTWFIIRILSFGIWPAVVHSKFAPGIHLKWIWNDVTAPLIGASIGLSIGLVISPDSTCWTSHYSRLEIFAQLLGIGFVTLLASIAASSRTRHYVVRTIRSVYASKLNLTSNK